MFQFYYLIFSIFYLKGDSSLITDSDRSESNKTADPRKLLKINGSVI